MKTHLIFSGSPVENIPTVYLLSYKSDLSSIISNTSTYISVTKKLEATRPDIISIGLNPEHPVFLVFADDMGAERYQKLENLRKSGNKIWNQIRDDFPENIQFLSFLEDFEYLLAFTEGFQLSAYSFDKYKTDNKKGNKTLTIQVHHNNLDYENFEEFDTILNAVKLCKDLVNEPSSYLTAPVFSEIIENIGAEAGFSVEVYNKAKIQALKMGGLLAVNFGSKIPPTFNIMEYKPQNPVNSKPIILVGKGVVFDTGGLSLKPAESMEFMKADMAGAAVVTAVFYAIAKNNLPLHVIGLIPATDNRPSENALAPGDVISIMNGKTVEVLNTDAEGRLILADALCFASRYDPELVIDLATLTGSALRAIGKEAIAMMSTAELQQSKNLQASGLATYERIVEFPLWKEYGDQLKSDIADIKNIGSPLAGAITAGKFLEYFTSYPWIHLDIAGVAFYNNTDSYRSKNATGIGVRLIYNFLKNYTEKNDKSE